MLLATTVTSNCQSAGESGSMTDGDTQTCPPYQYDDSLEQDIDVNINPRIGKNDPGDFKYIIGNLQATLPSVKQDRQACGYLDDPSNPNQQRPSSADISNTLICPWTYRCDYNPRRYPAYILHADCQPSTSEAHDCTQISYPVPVLRSDTGCNHTSPDATWKLTYEIVSVGCSPTQTDFTTLRRRRKSIKFLIS